MKEEYAKMEYDKFIGKLYDILIQNNIITFEDKPKDLKTKVERTEEYLGKLGRVQEKIMVSGRHLQEVKNLYYDKYVIKEEDIPDSYFEFLEKRYLEEGHGNHNLVHPNNGIDVNLRKSHIEQIINEQKSSLDEWLNYFLSDTSSYLPVWAKVWAFQGMLNIGNINEGKDGYKRRGKGNVNPFVSFDAEVLGRCVELLERVFKKDNLTDDELNKIMKSESFPKIYGKLLAKKKAIKLDSSTEGIWIKYNYETTEEAEEKLKNGQNPEYLKLHNSLQGYNTGWCTAGSRETAKGQICGSSSYEGGNFYVYYTKDKNGEYKIPRLAIRMDRDKIGEIRGIAQGQNIEPNMELVLQDKLKEFPDAEEYFKKVNDMKMLTKIYNEHKQRNLTTEELLFLYEINEKIQGFGWGSDPRIEEIINQRDKSKDISAILSVDKNAILKRIEYFKYVPKEMITKEIALEAVKQDGLALLNVPKDIEGYNVITMAAAAKLPILKQELNGIIKSSLNGPKR